MCTDKENPDDVCKCSTPCEDCKCAKHKTEPATLVLSTDMPSRDLIPQTSAMMDRLRTVNGLLAGEYVILRENTLTKEGQLKAALQHAMDPALNPEGGLYMSDLSGDDLTLTEECAKSVSYVNPILTTEETPVAPDGEMPDGSTHQKADDGKFHVPSQFMPQPDSDLHARYHAGMVVVFFRDKEQIAAIDFTDFACGPTAFEGATEDQITTEIIASARGIAHQLVLGGLKAGDTQMLEYSTNVPMADRLDAVTLTAEDIDNIGRRITTEANRSPRVALPGIDIPMED